MKYILTFLALTCIAVAQTQLNPLATNSGGDLNRSVKIPSGKSITVGDGGTLNLEAGANVTGLSAAFQGAGFITIDGVRTDGVATGGTHLSAEVRFITFKSTVESVSGDERLMRLPDASTVPVGTVIFYADLFNEDGPVGGGPYMFLAVQAGDFINGGMAGSGIILAEPGHWWSFRAEDGNNWSVSDLGALGPGGTGSGGGGTYIFEDDAQRLGKASTTVGQLGVQLDDGSLWRADGLSSGSWTGSFGMRVAGDAHALKLRTDYNTSASAPLFEIQFTDTGYLGTLFQITNDGGAALYIVDSLGTVLGTGLGAINDSGLNTRMSFAEDTIRFIAGNVTAAEAVSTGFRINSAGSVMTGVYSGSVSLNYPSIPTGSEATLTVTVTGAATNGVVTLGWSAALEDGIVVKQAWVSGVNTVSVRVRNVSAGAIDPVAVTCRAMVTMF